MSSNTYHPDDTSTEFDPLVSLFPNAYENLPTDILASQFIASIKGNQHKFLVTEIRQRFQKALNRGVPYEQAKRVVDSQKKKLPSVSFAGVLPMRDKKMTPQFTGLFQADLDLLGDGLEEILNALRADPHVYALFISPTGEGAKAIYRVPICQTGAEYELAYGAVATRVRDLTGVEIDKLADFTRLCFASHDHGAYLNPGAIELPVDLTQPVEEPVAHENIKSEPQSTSASLETRRVVAEGLLSEVEWESEILGHCKCPGAEHHTNADGPRGCRIYLDKVPTIFCVHKSCTDVVTDANRRLRSEFSRAEKSAAGADPTLHSAGHGSNLRDEYLGGDGAERPDGAEQPTLVERLAARMYSPTVRPDEPAPRFSLGDVPICTPGNLTAVSSQAKAGKTAAINAMIASTLAVPSADCLGFSSCNTLGHAVVHVDTEQCPFDHWDGVERMLRRAKVNIAPPWLRSYWLTGFSALDVRASVRVLLAAAATEFGGIHSVFIDGIADAVCDVNDPSETSSLITELQKLAIEFDCPVINIIHVNPGSDFKTRGHLGSQLERKSETNLRLEKDGDDITVIWADKNRRAPIPKNTAPRFAWNDRAGMHASVGSLRDAKDEGQKTDLQVEAARLFASAKKSSITYGEFVELIMSVVYVSKSTAKRRVEQMLRTQVVHKDLAGSYSLIK